MYRFPGQGQSGGDSKIPTVIIYNKDGDVQAVGAEAVDLEERLGGILEDSGLTKARWYRYICIHLRTSIMLTPGFIGLSSGWRR